MEVLLVAVCLFVARPDSLPVPLELNLDVGASYTYKTVRETTSEGGVQSVSMRITTILTYEIMSFEDGRYQVKETTESYSSEAPDSSFAGPEADYSGRVLTYSVGKDRTIKDWKLIEPGKMSEQLIGSIERSKKPVESRGLQDLVFPEGGVDAGAKWSQQTLPPVMSFGEGTSETEGGLTVEYKVIGFEDGGKTVVIEVSVDDTYFMSIETGGQTIDLESEVVEKRKIWVEVATGLVLKAESEGERVMITDFGEFVTKTKSTTELTKRS